jgi:WD40 repeat protein
LRIIPRQNVAFRADARRLAVGAPNGDLIIWDTAVAGKPTMLARLRHGRGIRGAAWNPAAVRLLATSSADGTAAIWHTVEDPHPQPIDNLPLWLDSPRHLGWLAGGRYLFCATGRGDVTVWHTQQPRLFRRAGLPVAASVVAACPTRSAITMITTGGLAYSWDPWRDAWRRMDLGGSQVTACAWSASSLAVAHHDGRIDVVDERLHPIGAVRIREHGAPHTMAFSDDSRLLVTVFPDGTVAAFDCDGRPRWQNPPGAGRAPVAVAVAGELVALAGSAGRPHILDITDGTPVISG